MEKSKRGKIITYIVCLIVAFVIWAFVISEVNPATTVKFRNIPVSITGEETLVSRGYAIAGEEKYTVDISVTGTRQDVIELSASDFTASADVSNLEPGENVLEINTSGPKGITINEITSSDRTIVIENYVSEEKDTKVFFSDAGSGYEETLFGKSADSITVSGAESDVDSVAYIRCDIVAEDLERDVVKTVSIACIPVDSNGNEVTAVELSSDTIEIDAAIYAVKNVQFSVVLEGESLYGPDGVASFEYPTAITIKGTSALLSTVSTVLSETINIEGVSEDTEYTLVPNLPKGVVLSRTQQALTGTLVINTEAKAAYEAQNSEEEQTDGETATDSAISVD